MKTLIVNGTNVVSGTNNASYKYDLPNGVEFKNQQLAVASINMYYSWPNITTATTNGGYDNNSFTYTWVDGTTKTVTMPDGFYDVSTLNAYLQSQMVANTHYLTNASSEYVYYLEFKENTSRYAVQLNSYAVPGTLPTSWTKPGTWALTNATPQVTILTTNNFYKVIGFTASATAYPTPVQTTTYSHISDFTPQVTPVSSVIMTCSIVDNKYSIPDNIVYSFAPTVTYGSQIQIQPSEFTWVDIQDGQCNSLTVTFLDQDKDRLPIQDSNLVILFSIREKSL
jgi:hypothetical protein